MFGDHLAARDDAAIFHLVWTYVIENLGSHKKTHFVCDGFSWSGSVQVFDETYVNCINQTNLRLFYAITTAENLLVFGAEVSKFFPTNLSTSNGYNIRNNPQSHLITLSQSFLPWKDTPNPHNFGKNMLTPSCRNLVWHQLYMNHAFTQETLPGNVSSSKNKWMSLL